MQNTPFPKIPAKKNSGDDLVADCAATGEFGHEYLWEKYTNEKGPRFTFTFSVLTGSKFLLWILPLQDLVELLPLQMQMLPTMLMRMSKLPDLLLSCWGLSSWVFKNIKIYTVKDTQCWRRNAVFASQFYNVHHKHEKHHLLILETLWMYKYECSSKI